MSQILTVWLVVLTTLVAANLPFVTVRLLGLIPLARNKSLGIRLLELLVLYFLTGGFALLLEQGIGQIAPQTWEFYAITGTLFVTFAFPGFVFRYLLKRPGR
jgi:surface polysaccharide O-acyltransferase-like enzyme